MLRLGLAGAKKPCPRIWTRHKRTLARQADKEHVVLGFGKRTLSGLDELEESVIRRREADKEKQRARLQSTPGYDQQHILQNVAESVDHDIARITGEDNKPTAAYEQAAQYGAYPSFVDNVVEVPTSDNYQHRPALGPTRLNPDNLPHRVTDEFFHRDDVTEQEYSSALIHGRSVFPPIYHPQTNAIPVASILFRSHDVFRLELFSHFTAHAAAALGIPISRTARVPVRRRLWTVLKSPFIYKKSQENFERKIHGRVIKAWDAHPEVIDRWISYLETHMYGGIGMRVTRWERAPLGAGALRAAYVQHQLGRPQPTHSYQIANFAQYATAVDTHNHALALQAQHEAEKQHDLEVREAEKSEEKRLDGVKLQIQDLIKQLTWENVEQGEAALKAELEAEKAAKNTESGAVSEAQTGAASAAEVEARQLEDPGAQPLNTEASSISINDSQTAQEGLEGTALLSQEIEPEPLKESDVSSQSEVRASPSKEAEVSSASQAPAAEPATSTQPPGKAEDLKTAADAPSKPEAKADSIQANTLKTQEATKASPPKKAETPLKEEK